MRHVLLVWPAVFALAACSGAGSTAPSTVSGCFNAPVVDMQAHLVSPAPGATGVLPQIGSITVAYTNVQVVDFGVTLTPNDGSPSITATSPSPGALPLSGVLTIPIPVLKSRTTYTVTGRNQDFAHVGCFTPVSANFGSFTTQ